MYKGKFDQKNKQTLVTVHELVEQRNAAPAKRPAAQSVNTRQSAARTAPAATQPAGKKQPAVQQQTPAKKKGPRLGGVIFYTLYFMFILVFFLATYLGLNWLHGWLSDFEAAQPTLKAKQVFQEVFTDPDWGALYEAAGAKDSP